MDISRDELLEALEHGLESGLTDANLLTGYVFGWRAGKELLNAGVPQEAPAQVPVWQVGDKIREANDLRTLPVGTILRDVEGDHHKHTEAGVWQFTVNGAHTGTRRSVENAFVLGYLPATVDFLPGGEPQVGDLVRSREDAVGEDNAPRMHAGCRKYTGVLVQPLSKGLYNNGFHVGPLSDFEKVEEG